MRWSSHPGFAIHRIQIRSVRRPVENPDLLAVATSVPGDHQGSEPLPPGLARQAQLTPEKIQKHPRRETLTENQETSAPIGDRRDHVVAEV